MRRRKGFTITELMVAMALIIFIMYILAEAFSSGAGAFRRLKAIGDMNEKLRTTLGVLRRDLQSDHFDGRKRMSDPDFWKDGPPREGFFRLYQVSDDAAGYEGSDLENNPSFRTVDHGLHFSVKLRGNNRGDFFRAGISDTTTAGGSPLLRLPFLDTRFQEANSTTICSPWVEKAFYLRDSGEVAEDPENLGLAPQPLYTLYMRQKLCLPDNELLAQVGLPRVGVAEYRGYAEMSCYQDPLDANFLYFNNPADLTMPRRRMNPALNGTSNAAAPAVDNAAAQPVYTNRLLEEDPTPALALFGGNDILLSNVLSFDVRILIPRDQFNRMIQAYDAAFPPPPPPNSNALLGHERVYDFISLNHRAFRYWMPTLNPNVPAGHRIFDTWSSAKDDAYDYSLWQPTSYTPANNRPETIPTFISIPVGGQTDRLRPLAIQITIRVWDSNTKQTRQSSIVVDL